MLAMNPETSEAVTTPPSTPGMVTWKVESSGTPTVSSQDLDVTGGFTPDVGDHDYTQQEELDEEWDITTIHSVSGGTSLENTGPWSWFPVRWTWAAIGQLVVGVIGIIGNLLVITVLFQRRANSRSTDTLIGALAVADLLTSVGLLRFAIPHARTVPVSWLGQIYCRIIWSPLYMWVWAYMSGFVLTAISVERYIAVTHPIYFNRILTRRRVSEVVVIIWICAVMACIPSVFITGVDQVNRRCIVKRLSPDVQTAYAFYVTIVQLFIPAIIMAVTQTLIAIKLNAQSKRFEGSKSYHLAASRAIIKMMLTVIIAYIICWTPNRFLLLITTLFRIQTTTKRRISEGFVVLAAINSSINPLIYSIRYQEFRQAVRDLFVGGKVRGKAMFDTDINTASTNDGTA
ncbi:somatostatin receptor type 5-like [Lytechinus variegatus]|uniref:somatostatin receptor type 5-like n=1 Tax=Lytechinus variegatus TaxID=7654 RepID=UPI001BB2AD74|nr:somatostatin receptor type 5-like [Lytechinus variegatus]